MLPCSLQPPWARAVGTRPASLTPRELRLFHLSLPDDALRAAEPREYRDFAVGCLARQMPNSSWFQPRSIERDCSAAGGTSGTCLDMSAAPIQHEKQGSAFLLSQSGPHGRPAASSSELVTTARLTASPLLPLQLKHLCANSVSLVCGGIATLTSPSTLFSGFSQTFRYRPGVKRLE